MLRFYGSMTANCFPQDRVEYLPASSGASFAPFNDLTTQMMNDQSRLMKLCEEMKKEVSKLGEEVIDLKENVLTLNSKVDKSSSQKKSCKKLPKDLSVRT